MKKINAFRAILFTLGIASLLFSCGGDHKETAKEETPKMADTAASMQMSPAPVFTPFDMAEITHSVKDYGKWRQVFNADSVNRRTNGLTDIVVGTGIDKPNNVFIALTVTDIKKAKAFGAAPELKAAMEKGSVNSTPAIDFFHVIRFNAEAKEKKWVIITHKVKDFEAWQKVYDDEGKEKRLGEGLIDVLIARGIDDPNLVQIVFDITDISKAKAAIASEEKKKLMMSAGVEGVPDIQYYNTAE